MLTCPGGAQAAELSANPATLDSVFAAASGGDTIRLAGGDYGTFRGGAKPAAVTLAPALGANATIEPSLSGASQLAFDGLTIAGAYVTGSRDIAFRNSRFTGMTRVDANLANANIVFDNDAFDGINICPSCYEGRLTVRGFGGESPVGIKITNSHFGGGGESDGVQVIGGAYGVQIGPGNEFTGLRQQSGYTAHVDPIQFYGEGHTVVTGNYFHDNSTGIMAGDGTDHATITNNVFVTDGEYPDQVVIGGGSDDVIRHNTFAGGASVRIGQINVSPSVGETVTDNVLTGGIRLTENQSASGLTLDYNLIRSGGTGAHDVKARPVFIGGSSPSSYAGFQLAAGSPGKGAASDGTDIGIDARAAGTMPPPQGGSGANGGSGTGARGVDAPPSLQLLRPRAGRLGRVLFLHAVATDDLGIAHVGLWIDARRVANRVRRPYTARRRVGALRHGSHTVSARAVDSSGQVTSVAAMIAGGRVLRGRVVSVPQAGGGTELRAGGFGGRRVVARVAECGGGTARRVTLSGSRTGTRLAAGGLCVVSLAQR